MHALRRFPALFCLIALTTVTSGAESATPPAVAVKKPLTSAVWDWDKLEVKTNANGARRDVVDGPSATFVVFESHVTTVNPGKSSHAPHKHAQEEFIILKEGTLDVHINGKISRVKAGDMFWFASNDMHNVTNVGDTPATYLVFNVRTGETAKAPAEGVEKAAVAGKMGSGIFYWDKMKVEAKPTGERRQIFDSPTTTLKNLEGHVTTLNEGLTPHAAHNHPDEELIVIKEGVVEATIDGVSNRGGPGSIFFFGSNSMHGMKNVGKGRATYYVFRMVTEKTPKAPEKK
jgi:quercetin dioxygenase-like cupin family protein